MCVNTVSGIKPSQGVVLVVATTFSQISGGSIVRTQIMSLDSLNAYVSMKEGVFRDSPLYRGRVLIDRMHRDMIFRSLYSSDQLLR